MSQMNNTEDLINRGVSLTIRKPIFKFFISYLFAFPETKNLNLNYIVYLFGSPEFQLSIFLILVLVMVICRHCYSIEGISDVDYLEK